jgi:hypothetical protein
MIDRNTSIHCSYIHCNAVCTQQPGASLPEAPVQVFVSSNTTTPFCNRAELGLEALLAPFRTFLSFQRKLWCVFVTVQIFSNHCQVFSSWSLNRSSIEHTSMRVCTKGSHHERSIYRYCLPKLVQQANTI